MKKSILKADEPDAEYQSIFGDVSKIIDAARQSAAQSVNAVMTAAYWRIGQCIVEFEQSGEKRAEYGTTLIERLAVDMTERFGRGFSRQNIWQMRQFYLLYPPERILQTASGESSLGSVASHFPLPWSAYVRLLSVKNTLAREFYETEALRGGWSVRQPCAQKDEAVARYALDGLPNKVMAAEYRTALPDEATLAAEIDRTFHKFKRRDAAH